MAGFEPAWKVIINKEQEGGQIMDNEMSQCRIIRKKELFELIGLSDTTVWRLERKGEFPKRLRLGPKSVGWRYGDVLRWIESKAEEGIHR